MTSKYTGYFKLILGPMMSGKTTELDREIRRLQCARRSFVTLKWDKDKRYLDTDEETKGDTLVKTHDQLKISGPIFACNMLADAEFMLQSIKATCVLIDELQFFEDAAKITWKWRLQGINIIASGLNGTAELKPWKSISECLPLCTEILYLTSICNCCYTDKANCSLFLHDASQKTEDVFVGGKSDYDARCAACFDRETNSKYLYTSS